MLTWTERDDGWYSNGFRIELRAPFQWALVDVNAEVPQVAVSTQAEPLAVARTLSLCKREAEQLAAAAELSVLRRRHTQRLLIAALMMPLVYGTLTVVNFVIFLTALFVVARSATAILDTFLADRPYDSAAFYQ